MRHLFAGLLVGAAIWTPRADQPFPPLRLDAPVEGAFRVADPVPSGVCGVWRTIEQIARRTQIQVGFQNSAGCALGGARLNPTESFIDLQGSSPRAAFEYVVNRRPEFSWRVVDGVVVIRPVSGWEAPTDALNRPVTPFRSENKHPHQALHDMLQNTQPVMFQPHTDLQLSSLGTRRLDSSATGVIDKPITVQFGGGSLLNALNAIAEPFHGIWQVGYSGQVSGTFRHIEMRTLDFQEGSTIITARVMP